jgi:excisionase family DNA binding protein
MQKRVELWPLLTPRQAAKLLHLPLKMLRKMIDRKELVAFRIGPHWRISKSELSKWSQTHRHM